MKRARSSACGEKYSAPTSERALQSMGLAPYVFRPAGVDEKITIPDWRGGRRFATLPTHPDFHRPPDSPTFTRSGCKPKKPKSKIHP